LAAQNHYPAVDILSSISRLMAEIVPKEHRDLAGDLRNILATYKNSEDLISIGAYNKGSNPKIDRAIKYIDGLTDFLKQDKNAHIPYDKIISDMEAIIK
jgi:flagellum-specific ATP synthase